MSPSEVRSMQEEMALAEKRGADRERRRIRRAQAKALASLWLERARMCSPGPGIVDGGLALELAWNTLDAATRSRGKGKRA